MALLAAEVSAVGAPHADERPAERGDRLGGAEGRPEKRDDHAANGDGGVAANGDGAGL